MAPLSALSALLALLAQGRFLPVLFATRAACTEKFAFQFGDEPGRYNESQARADWPRFRGPYDIPDPVVGGGKISSADAQGFAWYANLPGKSEVVTFQYVVDLTGVTSGGARALPGLCGDTCPTDGEAPTASNGFMVTPFIDGAGLLRVRMKLPSPALDRAAAALDSPVFDSPALVSPVFDSPALVSSARSNTIRIEVVLNVAGQTNGSFRLWFGGQLVYEADHILYRLYDDIFVRSLVLRATGNVALSDFRYWVGDCDVPVQYLPVDDLVPGTDLVVLADTPVSLQEEDLGEEWTYEDVGLDDTWTYDEMAEAVAAVDAAAAVATDDPVLAVAAVDAVAVAADDPAAAVDAATDDPAIDPAADDPTAAYG